MKKVKIQKKLFDTIKWTSGGFETIFFLFSKSKIVASVGGASKDKMVRIWATFKKI